MGTDRTTPKPAGGSHAAIVEPEKTLHDPTLSKRQKGKALDTLEQDARQLSVASAEGMGGGEASELHEILDAKASLELPPTEHAYAVVLQDLRARLKDGVPDAVRGVVERALTALGAVARLAAPDAAAPGAGSAGEMADEIARERLDP
jgi:hypothetical protein